MIFIYKSSFDIRNLILVENIGEDLGLRYKPSGYNHMR